jgi:hypothetical protein
MSFSYFDFSSEIEAECRISAAAVPVAPTENIWLDFDVRVDRKRRGLEAVLLRLLDEDPEGDARP